MGTVPFKAFSLEDDAFIQGGLLQNVDVEIVGAQWVPWDYGKPGVVQEDILAVKLTLQQLAEDHKPVTGADGQPIPPVEQYWSGGGNFADVIISDDGYMAGPGPNKAALTKDSNFHLFIKSLRDRGMPKGYLEDGNLSRLLHIKFHLIRTPAPKREGLTNQRANSEGDNKSIPVCGSIILPAPWGGAGAAPAKGRAAARPAAGTNGANGAPAPPTNTPAPAQAQSAPATDAETEAIAERIIREVLAGEPDTKVDRLQDLKVKVFRKATTDKTIAADKRAVIGKLAENAAWLENQAIALVDSGSGAVTLI